LAISELKALYNYRVAPKIGTFCTPYNFELHDVTVTYLLMTIAETISTLYPVVNFLKCVVTEVSCSMVALRH